MTEKERLARNQAEELAYLPETDVDPDEIAHWHALDVYEWLAAWGYVWDDEIGWTL